MTAAALTAPDSLELPTAPEQVQPSRRARRWPVRVLSVLGHVVLAVAAIAALCGAGAVVVYRLGFSPVLSPSMVPTFAAGDLIVTSPRPSSDIAVGDVLVLPIPDSPGQRYVHRVLTVTTGADGLPVVTTKGDANPAPDPWTLSITSAKVPAVITSVPTVGSLALHTRGSALRIPLLLIVAGGVLVAVKRALLDS